MVNPSKREGFNAGTEEGIKVNGAKGLVGPRHREQLLSLWERVLNCVRKLVLFRAWRSQVQIHY